MAADTRPIPLPSDPPPPEPEETEERKINRRPRRDELNAMHQIDGILEGMDDQERLRVLLWLQCVHGMKTVGRLEPDGL